MSGWVRSERDTQEMRESIDCPPDTVVYHQHDLKALVIFGDRDGQGERWHLYLASAKRAPTTDELLDARQELLPGIDDYDYAPDPEGGSHCLHLWELFATCRGWFDDTHP